MSGLLLSLIRIAAYYSIMAWIILPAMVHATEISTIKFTQLDGSIALRYLLDEQSLSAQGVLSREESYPTFQEEYALSTSAYIFHPNMLNMDLGGSLLYDQSEVETLSGDYSSSSQLSNYFAHIEILDKKPYPVSLFYEQQNPSISAGLAGRYIQENIRYGYNFSLLEPFSPVQVVAGAFRQLSQGEGPDQIVNDVYEQANIRLYHSYGAGNYIQLSHQLNQMDSQSGSPYLPIQQRIYTNETTNLDSRNSFGSEGEIKLTNSLSYRKQDEFPFREERRFSPNLNWQHSETTSSFYRYTYSKLTEDILETEDNSLVMGMAYSRQNASSSFDIHGYDNDAIGFESQNAGLRYSLVYQVPFNGSKLQLSYGGAYDRTNQASVSLLPVPEKQYQLIGTTPVELEHQFIDVSTLDVRNSNRQLLYEGDDLDYRLIIIGSRVQIVRNDSANPNIPDDIIIVKYSIKTGGTYEYDVLNQNLGVSCSFARYYEVYMRYFMTQQDLIEGVPTNPLNSVNRLTTGLSVDRPLPNGMSLGGEASYVNNDEDISPYEKQSYEIFVDVPMPNLTDVRLSASHILIDNEYSVEDTDLNGYLLRIRSQPWLRASLLFESSYENDTGGSIDRLWRQHRVQYGWQIRQLSVSLNTLYTTEEQGSIERERWSVKFVAKREF